MLDRKTSRWCGGRGSIFFKGLFRRDGSLAPRDGECHARSKAACFQDADMNLCFS